MRKRGNAAFATSKSEPSPLSLMADSPVMASISPQQSSLFPFCLLCWLMLSISAPSQTNTVPTSESASTNSSIINLEDIDPELLNDPAFQEALKLAEDPLLEDFKDPTWLKDFTIVTAGGYKDNVTLANQSPSASPFIYTGAELFFSRLPKERRFFDHIESFMIFDDVRFTDSDSVEKEQLGFGQGTIRKVFGSRWHFSLTGEYLYQDQVLDVSLTETNQSAIQVLGHRGTLQPGVRMDLSTDRWIELAFPITRQRFDEPLDDYWAFGPKLSLVQNYSKRSRLQISYEGTSRRYDTDLALDRNGARIPGSSRILNLHEFRMGWRHYWDEKRRWRTYLRTGYKFTLDNGGQYFNYKKPFASIQGRFRNKGWDLSATASFSYYTYPVQPASDNTGNRERKALTFSLRGEKELRHFLVAFAEVEHEQTYSNDALDEYTVNTVTGGLNWRF